MNLVIIVLKLSGIRSPRLRCLWIGKKARRFVINQNIFEIPSWLCPSGFNAFLLSQWRILLFTFEQMCTLKFTLKFETADHIKIGAPETCAIKILD